MSEPLSRRGFLRVSSAALLAGRAALGQAQGPKRVRKGEMVYRRLGRTNLVVSEISLGGSPIPPEPVFAKAIERGVNYVDSSEFYNGGNSERTIGQMIKGRRDTFHVATKGNAVKLFPPSADDLVARAEKSLERLGTDYIDIYMIHHASKPEHLTHEEILKGFDRLKKAGKIRFTGASLHGNLVQMARTLIESGYYDVFDMPYNIYSGAELEKGKSYEDYLKRSGIDEILSLAMQKDIGVVAMKSMAGGNLQKLDRYLVDGTTLPQAKLKWILQNGAVGTIISEMLTFDILKENLAVVGTGLTLRERDALFRYAQATSHLHCRMCGVCQEVCPNGVATTDIQRFLAYHDGYGKVAFARQCYSGLPRHRTAALCQDCGACEAACPYGVAIRQRLRAAQALA